MGDVNRSMRRAFPIVFVGLSVSFSIGAFFSPLLVDGIVLSNGTDVWEGEWGIPGVPLSNEAIVPPSLCEAQMLLYVDCRNVEILPWTVPRAVGPGIPAREPISILFYELPFYTGFVLFGSILAVFIGIVLNLIFDSKAMTEPI